MSATQSSAQSGGQTTGPATSAPIKAGAGSTQPVTVIKEFYGSWHYDSSGDKGRSEEERRSATIELRDDGTCSAKRSWDRRLEKDGDKPKHDKGSEIREGLWQADPKGGVMKLKFPPSENEPEKEITVNESPLAVNVLGWPWSYEADKLKWGLLK